MAMTDVPPKGSVIVYPYLWLDQARAGETEGRRARPVCMVLKVHDQIAGLNHLLLLAISSKPPSLGQKALEIPDTERRRVKLDVDAKAWVYVSEYNYDIAGKSFYFEPGVEPLGRFSAAFRQQVATALQPIVGVGGARVERTRDFDR